MHMSSKCTQHVITGFQVPLPPVLIAIGLYDNDAFQNSLPTRRAMMHSVAMAEQLWEMSRAKRDRVGLVVSGMTLPLLINCSSRATA